MASSRVQKVLKTRWQFIVREFSSSRLYIRTVHGGSSRLAEHLLQKELSLQRVHCESALARSARENLHAYLSVWQERSRGVSKHEL